ncbi:hypothetical protein GYMLUDRAFT_417924 [Collybiopsis luxurians FD-317 M1]|uniref:Uncharacterized protein n=1 Tax=Collybiopsis luxurians FD-317 M1 TaxID=944289 RepID=A0A0D0AKV3_9AGAR|nr:hypothetical protein GYMLUDRAFT_417924 [Collybiopsis luxurians FD-317 M1]
MKCLETYERLDLCSQHCLLCPSIPAGISSTPHAPLHVVLAAPSPLQKPTMTALSGIPSSSSSLLLLLGITGI